MSRKPNEYLYECKKCGAEYSSAVMNIPKERRFCKKCFVEILTAWAVATRRLK